MTLPMRCPSCNHIRTRIIRTRPDPDSDASDLVRQCKAPACLTVFTSHEAVISVIENSQDKHILMDLAARIAKLPDTARAELAKLIQMD